MRDPNPVCGGPSEGDEKCPECGETHFVRRSGSYDWEPRVCNECSAKQLEHRLQENSDNLFGDVLKKKMLINLVDVQPGLCEAWRKEFKDVAGVNVIQGKSILDIEASAIVSPANSFGFMDGGIDLTYSEFFGWGLQKRLQEQIAASHHGELPVGCAVAVSTDNQKFRWLISAPTMRVPMNVQNTTNAYLAFRAALLCAVEFDIQSVSCPGLGTGVGGLSFDRCAKQMRMAYDTVFAPNKPFATWRESVVNQAEMFK